MPAGSGQVSVGVARVTVIGTLVLADIDEGAQRKIERLLYREDFRRALAGEIGDALGQPFVDSRHPSPVQHPYRWSSLGVNGAQDAYTIRLGINFGAQFRVTVNGSTGGWQGLPTRDLSWSASHRVQEAQAVLTRP